MKSEEPCDRTLYSGNHETAFLMPEPLPSMPMSSRLDVSCPQFLLACCLLIQFQLKPRKSTTIFFPTVSFRVCCKYTLEMHEKRDVKMLCASLFYVKQVAILVIFQSPINLSAGYKQCALKTTSPSNHKQYDIEGSRPCKSK